MAPSLNVMDLKSFYALARLATPAISIEDFAAELATSFRLKPQAGSACSDPFQNVTCTSSRSCFLCGFGRPMTSRMCSAHPSFSSGACPGGQFFRVFLIGYSFRITDGQLCGLCNKGLTGTEVSPKSAFGGPISLVMNGDIIMIDVDQRILAIRVSGANLAARHARLGEPVLPKATGYLSIYQQTVQPIPKGAVLVRETPNDKS
jgi:hypothetical protein